MLSLEVEAQPVPQETTKNHKRSAAQGETTAARRDGAQQGDCQRSKRRVQQTPGERTTDRNLGASFQPQYRPSRIERKGKIPGDERQGENGQAKEPAKYRDAGTTAAR